MNRFFPASRWLLLPFIWLLLVGPAHTHPTNPNDAINASTIMEMFITERSIRVELEIGAKDLAVFEDLLNGGVNPQPTAEQKRFFQRGLIIDIGEDKLLSGRLIRKEQRKRIARDSITGEPIPIGQQTSPAKETVTFAEIQYELDGPVEQLHLRPPYAKDGSNATIGLVVYHQAIPINDFDYFKLPVGIRLDPKNPWKSSFRGVRLTRYYNSPAWASLAIEPREIRIEIMLRPEIAEAWLQPQPPGETPRNLASLQQLATAAQPLHANWFELTVEGRPVDWQFEPIGIVRQSLAKMAPANWDNPPPREAAFLLLAYRCPHQQLPKKVEVRWKTFAKDAPDVPVWVNTDTVPVKLSATSQRLTWESPALEDSGIPQPAASERKLTLPILIIPAGLIALIAIGSPRFRHWPEKLFICTICGLLALAGNKYRLPIATVAEPPPRLQPDDQRELLGFLLRDAYRAFDCREEEDVYDTLALNVTGSVLKDAYLSIRKMLDAPEAGRARVRHFQLISTEITSTGEGQYQGKALWTIYVAISHYGHTHLRINTYEGELTIEPHQGRWKISRLKILDEQQSDPAAGPKQEAKPTQTPARPGEKP